MPAGFPAAVALNVQAFEDVYDDFKNASLTGVETDKKRKANNTCYTSCREMLDDAVIIYRKNPVKSDRCFFCCRECIDIPAFWIY